jgi:predicted transcriptional regulator
MKTTVIGVMPQEQIRARAIAIAKGKYKPKPGVPKIWFTSMKSVTEVLSDQNRALLKVIRETNPEIPWRCWPRPQDGNRAICRAP